jgi:hypothetical protein
MPNTANKQTTKKKERERERKKWLYEHATVLTLQLQIKVLAAEIFRITSETISLELSIRKGIH